MWRTGENFPPTYAYLKYLVGLLVESILDGAKLLNTGITRPLFFSSISLGRSFRSQATWCAEARVTAANTPTVHGVRRDASAKAVSVVKRV